MVRPWFLYALAGTAAAALAWSVYRAIYPPEAADASGAAAGAIESALYRAQNLALGALGERMKLSDAGLAQLARREGFSATPYQDAGGYSIGYGHYLQDGEWWDRISEADASVLLARDVRTAEDAVNSLVSVPLNQSQFDALVSFVYNIGAGAFRTSTMRELLNSGDLAGAAAQFAVWKKSQGQVLAALVTRRQIEAALFTHGVYA
jgi:GH24 family phage-related lysozyme (muramidase)